MNKQGESAINLYQVFSHKLLYVFYHSRNLRLKPKQTQKKDASTQSLEVSVLMSTDLHHICPEGQCIESIRHKNHNWKGMAGHPYD